MTKDGVKHIFFIAETKGSMSVSYTHLNLDVLKVLRETYLGKVKMIYIDPPYNTGNDFVYNDEFAPVSYTHLDVYKRQKLHFNFEWNSIS